MRNQEFDRNRIRKFEFTEKLHIEKLYDCLKADFGSYKQKLNMLHGYFTHYESIKVEVDARIALQQ